MTETNMREDKHITYDSIKIGLASPEKIREWSQVKLRSLKPSIIGH